MENTHYTLQIYPMDTESDDLERYIQLLSNIWMFLDIYVKFQGCKKSCEVKLVGLFSRLRLAGLCPNLNYVTARVCLEMFFFLRFTP